MTLRDILSSGLFLQSIGTVGLLFSKKQAAQAEPAPIVVAPPSPDELMREKLRQDHKVQLILSKDEGSGIQGVPAGTYGWTYAPLTESPLFAKRAYESFEMHKASNGAMYLIGYVSKAAITQISGGEEDIDFKLYPETSQDASELVCLPLARARSATRQPKRETGNWIQVILEPR